MKALIIALLSLTLIFSNAFALEANKKSNCHCSCQTHSKATPEINDKS